MQLPDRIKKIRKIVEQSQLTFAEILGVNRAHISKIETGKATPSKQLIKLICNKFSVREEWLINGKGDIEAGEPLTKDQTDNLKDALEKINYTSLIGAFDFYTQNIILLKGGIKKLKSERDYKNFKINNEHQDAKVLIETSNNFMKNLKTLQKEVSQLLKSFSIKPKY